MSDVHFRLTLRNLPDDLAQKYWNVYTGQLVVEFPRALTIREMEWHWKVVELAYSRLSGRRLPPPEKFEQEIVINVPKPIGGKRST